MHITQALLGQIAAVIAALQVVPYIWTIFKGRTRPSRASYGIWSVIQIIQLASYIAAGATTTKWALLVLTINSVIIFGLSLKYGMGGRNKFDIPCLLIAGVAVILWATTHNSALAVYMSTLAGLVGYLPTIKKAYVWPRSENKLSWGMYVVAASFNVGALTSIKPAIAVPPLLGFILSTTVAGLLLFPRWKMRNLRRKYSAVPADA